MIICLSGWKQSGKDTVAQYLVDNYSAIRVALADPLKDSVAKEYNIPRSWLDDLNFKEKPLLDMPVDPKDAFTKMIAEFMVKEFVREDGTKPDKSFYQDGKFYGGFTKTSGKSGKNGTFSMSITEGYPLYWTPRALAILRGSTNRAVNPNFWTEKAFSSIMSKQTFVITDVRYKSEVEQFAKKFPHEAVFVRVNRHKESPSNDPSERDLDSYEFDHHIDNTGSLSATHRQIEDIMEALNKKNKKPR